MNEQPVRPHSRAPGTKVGSPSTEAYTYILQCADGTLYVGWTTDLERRIHEHSLGRGAKYTRGRRPLRLVFWEEQASRTLAQQREQTIRRMSRSRKLQLIVSQKGGEEPH